MSDYPRCQNTSPDTSHKYNPLLPTIKKMRPAEFQRTAFSLAFLSGNYNENNVVTYSSILRILLPQQLNGKAPAAKDRGKVWYKNMVHRLYFFLNIIHQNHQENSGYGNTYPDF